MVASPSGRRAAVLALALAHGVNDSYGYVLPAVLPALIPAHGLSLGRDLHHLWQLRAWRRAAAGRPGGRGAGAGQHLGAGSASADDGRHDLVAGARVRAPRGRDSPLAAADRQPE